MNQAATADPVPLRVSVDAGRKGSGILLIAGQSKHSPFFTTDEVDANGMGVPHCVSVKVSWL
jgi:hypothetical protein